MIKIWSITTILVVCHIFACQFHSSNGGDDNEVLDDWENGDWEKIDINPGVPESETGKTSEDPEELAEEQWQMNRKSRLEKPTVSLKRDEEGWEADELAEQVSTGSSLTGFETAKKDESVPKSKKSVENLAMTLASESLGKNGELGKVPTRARIFMY
jgi:cell division protein FtsN